MDDNLYKAKGKTPVKCEYCGWKGIRAQANLLSETIEPLCWVPICPSCDEPVELDEEEEPKS